MTHKNPAPMAVTRLVFSAATRLVNSRGYSLVDKWRHEVLASLLPRRCQFCGSHSADQAICTACAAELPWNYSACPRCARPQNHHGVCADCLAHPPAFGAAWAPFQLQAPVQQRIHAIKYRADFGSARLLARLMARAAPRPLPAQAVLIPVPLHRRRLWQRGYNQSLELARELHRELKLPLQPGWARRLRSTADQIGMDAAARRRNLRNAFAVDARVAGRCVILLDDVMTTGATLHELARACRRAGASEVWAWALARVA